MTDLQTDDRLLQALRKAASRGATEEEIHKQRISFIISNLSKDSSITRAQIEKVVEQDSGSLRK